MALLSYPVRAWIKHRFLAGNRHDVHSPFVFALVNEALRKRTPPERFATIEELRHELLHEHSTLSVNDLGAGSRTHGGRTRRISTIARTALKPRDQAEQLARIADHFRPNTVLELGTSLGITTLYLAQAAPTAQVHTIEGCPTTAAVAEANFSRLRAGNIALHTGAFTEMLPPVLATLGHLDMAYIDGHHAYAPTLDYFEQCLAKAHNDSVFVFDDIHWSVDMERAWSAIRVHPRVTVTIDLFHFGLVFLRREQQREHFRLRY